MIMVVLLIIISTLPSVFAQVPFYPPPKLEDHQEIREQGIDYTWLIVILVGLPITVFLYWRFRVK